jgi:putative salt-induced outer membrane protein
MPKYTIFLTRHCLPVGALALGVAAGDVMAQGNKPWDIEVELGAIATTGNTETTSIHAKLDAKQNLERFTNQYILNSLFKEDEVVQDGSKIKETTAEKYLASLKSSYQISTARRAYVFGFASHTHDEFGAYRDYTTIALGYGNWLYASDRLTWFAEAGPGYFRGEKVIGSQVDSSYVLETEQGALLRAATELEWKLSDTAAFKQILSVEAGSDNTRSQSETSLAAAINHSLQMKLALAIANDSKVAPGKEKTDTTTSATLVYKF